MILNINQIQQIESVAQSPFYLCDDAVFGSNYDRIVAAFTARWPQMILAYSYKTNYIPWLCRLIRDKGGWAEVVSQLEYELAVKVGQDPAKIIFNGPVKTADDIELALLNNSVVNLDSAAEIEHLQRYSKKYPDSLIPVGLRINMGLSDANGRSQIQNQLPVSRFGFSPAGPDMMQLKQCLQAIANCEVVSLHGHTSTSSRSLACYQTITRTLCEMAEWHFPQTVQYINIGGGMFGDVPPEMGFSDVPTFDQYAAAVGEVLQASDWAAANKPTLVVEPGIAMSANVISLVTKVIGIKTIQNRTLVTVDASVFHAKPTQHSRNQPWTLIAANDSVRPSAVFSVVGSTCMEKDYLLTDVSGPLPQVGDYIQISQAGAYTVVMSPPFINPAPAIVVPHGENFKIIRTRQTLDDMFSNYRF
ncbi:MAG: diaminopimelate decarboxylase [Anaerohalosphaeraceae bacterium]